MACVVPGPTYPWVPQELRDIEERERQEKKGSRRPVERGRQLKRAQNVLAPHCRTTRGGARGEGSSMYVPTPHAAVELLAQTPDLSKLSVADYLHT